MSERERRVRKHSQEMRDAVVRAVLEQGYTAGQVVELAAEGRLAGLPAFEISPSTVNDLASRARKDRPRAAGGDQAADDLRAVARKTIDRVKQLENPTAKDMAAMQQAHRLLQQANRADPRRLPDDEARRQRASETLSGPEFARRSIAALAKRDKARGPGACECDRPYPSWWPEGHRLIEDGEDWRDGSSWRNPACSTCGLEIDDPELDPHPDVVSAVAEALGLRHTLPDLEAPHRTSTHTNG